MKNLILGCVMIFSLSSFSIDADPPLVRSWWKTLLVDAAGALGGAGSVASIGSWAFTNPVSGTVAAVAMGAGAILGGAGASMAMVIPPNGTLSLEAINQEFTYALNESNENDGVGKGHNDLIVGFIKSEKKFNTRNYIDYIKGLKNPDFIKALEVVDFSYLESEFTKVSVLRNESDVFDLIEERLPQKVDKPMFLKDLSKLMVAENVMEFVDEVKRMESKYSNEKDLSESDVISLNSFFSTLRHSAALWKK